MSKMDTQGMGAPMSEEALAKWKASPDYKETVHKPAVITPRRLFTPTFVKELKILINEVLDERDYNKKLEGPYDNPEPLGHSYFDVEHFRHYVGEEEPPYNR